MVGTQPWHYGNFELENLSKKQDDFAVGSSYDGHHHPNYKGHDHKGEGSNLKESSYFQTCEAT